MGRNKGVCVLCGRGTKLTFEHVPPAAAFNVPGVHMYRLENWQQRDTDTGRMSGGQVQPDGTGSIALCKECNGFLGREYVPAFIKLAHAGAEILRSLPGGFAHHNQDPQQRILGVEFRKLDRLRAAKQILAMLAVTTGRKVMVAHSALLDFIRDPEARGIPAPYRMFLAVSPGPMVRSTGLTGILNVENREVSVVTELVYPPFGYALSVKGSAAYPAGEITDWASAEAGEATVSLSIPLGFVHTPFAADLRSGAAIIAEMAADTTKADREASERQFFGRIVGEGAGGLDAASVERTLGGNEEPGPGPALAPGSSK